MGWNRQEEWGIFTDKTDFLDYFELFLIKAILTLAQSLFRPDAAESKTTVFRKIEQQPRCCCREIPV